MALLLEAVGISPISDKDKLTNMMRSDFSGYSFLYAFEEIMHVKKNAFNANINPSVFGPDAGSPILIHVPPATNQADCKDSVPNSCLLKEGCISIEININIAERKRKQFHLVMKLIIFFAASLLLFVSNIPSAAMKKNKGIK